MIKRSAALLVYRLRDGVLLEILIGHMGGPFWAKKDAGGWSLPKGEFDESEEPFAAALREFQEETGFEPPSGPFISLGEFRQSSGKIITAFAARGDYDLAAFKSNDFEMEWPKGSGRTQSFPEIDRVDWFSLDAAKIKLLKGHIPILDELVDKLRQQDLDFRTEPTVDNQSKGSYLF